MRWFCGIPNPSLAVLTSLNAVFTQLLHFSRGARDSCVGAPSQFLQLTGVLVICLHQRVHLPLCVNVILAFACNLLLQAVFSCHVVPLAPPAHPVRSGSGQVLPERVEYLLDYLEYVLEARLSLSAISKSPNWHATFSSHSRARAAPLFARYPLRPHRLVRFCTTHVCTWPSSIEITI